MEKADESTLLQAMLHAAADAIIVSDNTGTILRANPAACEIFGYTMPELVGDSIERLMPQPVGALHNDFMQHHITVGPHDVVGTYRSVKARRKDNSIFPLHIYVGLSDIAGQHIFIAIMHDPTHQNATLDALQQAQRIDAVRRMTGDIAHDFNNLLTVVIGNLELLEMRAPSQAQLPLIRDALSSAALGAGLSARLMIFAQRRALSPVETDLRDLCENVLSILRRTLGAEIRIKTDFPTRSVRAMVDPMHLQSALIYLALNARDAMGMRGTLLISLAVVTVDDTLTAQETGIRAGDFARLSISADGAGMAPQTQTRAFEPVFTNRNGSEEPGSGLATVYGFVQQSGGHVTLDSEPGCGTRFCLHFPALPCDDVETEGSGKPDKNIRQTTSHHTKTVLVVEDNPCVRKLSVERIRDLGLHTQEAVSADAAYEMLKGGAHVDIVFSDLVMPGLLNGYDLAALVASEFPRLKVLLTSGYSSDLTASRMAHHEHYDILQKPYRQSDLAHRFQELLAGESLA